MAYWIHLVVLIQSLAIGRTQVEGFIMEKRRADMAYWIHIVVIFQSLTNVEGALYVSEKPVSSDEAASMCNLTTPDIDYRAGGNNVSLDGSNLNIADGESVWSGYVQTYAAFLYEGCYQEEFVTSSAKYTNMYMDPGECYSRCKTDVIGMQTTTCHCNPRPKETKSYTTGCDTTCSNPADTVCGGNGAVSIYRKVQYRGSNGRPETGNCRAYYFWKARRLHFNTWKSCQDNYAVICKIDESRLRWYNTWTAWGPAVGYCLQKIEKPASDLFSVYPTSNSVGGHTIWIGQIRSRVIDNDKDSIEQAPGWRRGVIKKAGGEYWLVFHSKPTALKSLCEYATTPRNGSEPKSIIDENPQFPIIAVYVAVPTVLVLAAVVVIVICCKRRRNGRGNEERTTEVFYQNTDDGIAVDLGNRPQNQTIGHEAQLGGNYQQENQDLSHRNRVTSTHEYSTIGNAALSDEEPTQDYQDLNPQYENPPTHEYSTIGHEEQLDDNPQHEYQDLNPRFRMTSTHEYSTIVNAAHSDEEPSQDYQDLNLQYENSSTHEYSTIGK